MLDGPGIARIAALIGDPARAQALTALLGGQALTAAELAEEAGVTPQTISAHLGKLVDAELLAVEQQGRHRYFRLAGHEVAHALESLMQVAARRGPLRVRPGARACATTILPAMPASRYTTASSRGARSMRATATSRSPTAAVGCSTRSASTSTRSRSTAAHSAAPASTGACA